MFCLLLLIKKEKSADVSGLLPHSSHSEFNICSVDYLLAQAHHLHLSSSSEKLGDTDMDWQRFSKLLSL